MKLMEIDRSVFTHLKDTDRRCDDAGTKTLLLNVNTVKYKSDENVPLIQIIAQTGELG